MKFFFKFILSKFYFSLFKFVQIFYRFGLFKTYVFKKNNIISVGNLSLGGSGKTPMVVSLSKILSELNMSHAIVSRGYKRKSRGEVVVSDGEKIVDDCFLSGDEPLMLASMLPGVPVVVGDKARSCQKVIKLKKYKTIIIDDGFQTFKIKKDLNVLLLDLSRDKGDYRLLPLGRLREPLSAISRAHIIVFTKSKFSSNHLKNFLSSFIDAKKQIILESQFLFSPLKYKNNRFFKIKGLVDLPVLSLSGIENSSSFVDAVNDFFPNVLHNLVFKDHCDYGVLERKKINSVLIEKQISTIVTTMKDFVKIKNLFQNVDFYVINVDCVIINKKLLVDRLNLLRN